MSIINIQTTANKQALDKLKAFLLSIDPDAVMTFEDDGYDYDISDEDAKKLDEALEKIERGEAKFYTLEEVKERSIKHLRSLGADV